MSMCVYMCMCVYVCWVYVYTCMCMCMCVYVYMYIYVYTYVFLNHVIDLDITVALPCYIMLFVNMQFMYVAVPCKMVCLE